MSLRTDVRESHWNDYTSRVRKRHPKKEAIDDLIARCTSEAQGEILKFRTDREAVTVEGHRGTRSPETPEQRIDFFAFAQTVIDAVELRGEALHDDYGQVQGLCRHVQCMAPTLLISHAAGCGTARMYSREGGSLWA